MASSSSRRQNTKIISKEDVLLQLRHSCTFSWCIYRKRDRIRHVGIIIMFDGKPFCTADFGIEDPRPVPLLACGSNVFIKRVKRGFKKDVDYCPDIQCLDTSSECCRRYAAWIIHHLVTPNNRLYSLLTNNCRHNTIDAVNRVCDSGQCIGANLEDTRQMLLETLSGDLQLHLIAILIAGALGFRFLMRPRQ